MFSKKNKDPEYIDLLDGDIMHRVVIKRTHRKSVSLSVKTNGEVVMHSPMWSRFSILEKVARENIAWITTKVETMRSKKDKVSATYENGSTVLFMGEDIVLYTGQSQREEIRLETDGFYVRATDPIDVRLSVKSFYRKQAKELFRERTDYWLGKISFASTDTKIIIKTMATRWGSMSSTGRMNLNIALMRTPIECIDYVIVHELCHQRHPHHQPPFWAEVAGIMPNYKQWEKVLKSYATEDL